MNNVIELATATISSFLDVQAQLLVQLERLQPAVPKCSECGDNRTDLSLYCSPCLNSDGWYQLSTDEASRIESAQPVVPKSAAWQAGYDAGVAMAKTWRDDALQHAGQGEVAAWVAKYPNRAPIYHDDEQWLRANCNEAGYVFTPLYTHPQPAVPDVTPEMKAAGMEAWDNAVKKGIRQWPEMVECVFLAMLSAGKETDK